MADLTFDDFTKKLRELATKAQTAPCDHGCYDGHEGGNRFCYVRRQAFQEMMKMLSHPDPVLTLLDAIDMLRDTLRTAKEKLRG